MAYTNLGTDTTDSLEVDYLNGVSRSDGHVRDAFSPTPLQHVCSLDPPGQTNWPTAQRVLIASGLYCMF